MESRIESIMKTYYKGQEKTHENWCKTFKIKTKKCLDKIVAKKADDKKSKIIIPHKIYGALTFLLNSSLIFTTQVSTGSPSTSVDMYIREISLSIVNISLAPSSCDLDSDNSSLDGDKASVKQQTVLLIKVHCTVYWLD